MRQDQINQNAFQQFGNQPDGRIEHVQLFDPAASLVWHEASRPAASWS
jgi:hypothetical protein